MKINVVAIPITTKNTTTIMEKNADVRTTTSTNIITSITTSITTDKNRSVLALMTVILALADVSTAAV